MTNGRHKMPIGQIKAKINTLKEELAELESLVNAHKKFEFAFHPQKTYMLLTYCYQSGYAGTDKDYIKAGRYRTTKEGADCSLARNRRGNRLEMLVEYLGGLKEFNEKEDNHFIYLCLQDWEEYAAGTWYVGTDPYVFHSEKVYMTKEVADEVAEMLNNKEYEL